jgi:ABC-type transport system involved in cytochrome bd biosynthesis fused ATPase/permease subunit
MKIITAAERLKQQTGVKMAIFGSYGVGKTSLLKTLDEPTLCLDFEAGLLAVQNWDGDSITVRTWPDARDIALKTI